VTFLVDPPRPIEVETDAEGRPERIRGEPLDGRVEPVQRWIAEVDWWRRPVSREYWRVLLQDRLLCEIYHDLDEGAWYVERVYD
jgi:hypothetical protein